MLTCWTAPTITKPHLKTSLNMTSTFITSNKPTCIETSDFEAQWEEDWNWQFDSYQTKDVTKQKMSDKTYEWQKQQIVLSDDSNEAEDRDKETEESHQDWRAERLTEWYLKDWNDMLSLWINLDEYIWNNKVV